MSTATLTIQESAVLLDREGKKARMPALFGGEKRHVDSSKTSRFTNRGAALAEPEPEAQSRRSPDLAPADEEALAAERRMLRAIRKGDERAFARLVHAYQDRVYGVCLRMVRRPEEAEDLAQEVFVSLHRGLSNFRGQAKLSTWIYKVTRNHCLNRLKYLERRREDAKVGLEKADSVLHLPVGGQAPARPDQHLEGMELQAQLESALGALSEEQRLLVILRDLDGLTYEEIVEVCELPLGTVKSRLHRARLALAEALRTWREGGSAPAKTDSSRVPKELEKSK